MHSTYAAQLAQRLRTDLRDHPQVDNVEPTLLNDSHVEGFGYAVRVHLADGTHRDLIGSPSAGYQFTDTATGWRNYDRLLAEEFGPSEDPTPAAPKAAEEVSPADDNDLIEHLASIATALRILSQQVGQVRDELVLRGRL